MKWVKVEGIYVVPVITYQKFNLIFKFYILKWYKSCPSIIIRWYFVPFLKEILNFVTELKEPYFDPWRYQWMSLSGDLGLEGDVAGAFHVVMWPGAGNLQTEEHGQTCGHQEQHRQQYQGQEEHYVLEAALDFGGVTWCIPVGPWYKENITRNN